ncbi:SDR family oxidoreductase [Photobacterium ganghwense]|uniref:SDR family oxidoreductase n=1 Tax=Photobacterium ganghwense TaxID=320778 RepID=UPI001C2D5DAD|nr:SDR family oxidoreductase [Photobacterium ganghwense]MBV1842173.1 SDR family oxidoreductase [Photobacterium ganghwense]
MKLTNKRVLLTGATGGIGSALARQLAAKGANLILVGRNQSKLGALLHQISRGESVTPAQHLSLCADLSQPDDIEALHRQCLTWRDQGITIDMLINNAGSNEFAYLAQRSSEAITRELQLNLLAPILLCQKAMSWLNRPGQIMNIGSTFGAIGYPGYTTYCAGKAGLYRFSEALNRELSDSGITVQYLGPRATDTDLNDQRVTELNQQLGNKTDSPEAVATAIVHSLEQETPARWLGWPEKLFVRLNQLIPKVVTASIRKQHATITDFARKLP